MRHLAPLLLAALSACATFNPTYGLRSDAVLPAPGELTLAASGGLDLYNATTLQAPLAATATLGTRPGKALWASGRAYPAIGLYTVEVDRQRQVLSEGQQPVNLMLSSGLGLVGPLSFPSLSMQAGAAVSRTLEIPDLPVQLRPYGGGRLVLLPGNNTTELTAAVGLTLPELGEARRLKVGAEVYGRDRLGPGMGTAPTAGGSLSVTWTARSAK